MRRFPAGVLLSTGGAMFAVTIDLDAYDNLPPRQLKAMLRALRFADSEGVVRASLTMLATPGLSRSTVHRELAGLEDAGHVARQERPEGGFLWRIGRRFRSATKGAESASFSGCRRPAVGTLSDQVYLVPPADSRARAGIPARNGTPVPPDETPVPQRGTPDSRATPAVKNLSSGSKEPSERELSLSQDEIPNGWEAAAAAERRLAGLAPVNLMAEWRKLVAYSEGQWITIWRWRGWALKARGERPSANGPGVAEPDVLKSEQISPNLGRCPGDERQQRQARDWVRTGFWLRSGVWGPAPDQPGCTLPAGLVAWCLRERAVRAAA